jgi:hypothetical protein
VLVAVDLLAAAQDDRLHLLDVGTEPLHERTDGRDHHRGQRVAALPQPPHDPEPAAHRLERG